MDTKKIGNKGEDRACFFLLQNGYKILFRNWHDRQGELDIIAEKNQILIFVEVKTIPNGTIDMLQQVLGPRKKQKIIKTSKRFLYKYRKYSMNLIRYDVIVLDMEGLPSVYHIENAFMENL